jgi:hypothetical protein
MDLEAKTATVDSMEVAMEKQRVIDSMQVEMAKVETQKETIIVNQPENNNYHHDNHTTKERLSTQGAVIGAGVGAATGL